MFKYIVNMYKVNSRAKIEIEAESVSEMQDKLRVVEETLEFSEDGLDDELRNRELLTWTVVDNDGNDLNDMPIPPSREAISQIAKDIVKHYSDGYKDGFYEGIEAAKELMIRKEGGIEDVH